MSELLNELNQTYSDEQIIYWYEQILSTYKDMEPGFILQILKMYNQNPELLNNIVKEHKQDPSKFIKVQEELKYEL